MGAGMPKEAIEVFRRMMKEMELANPIAVNREEELEALSNSVNPVRLKNNPVRLDDLAIACLYDSLIV